MVGVVSQTQFFLCVPARTNLSGNLMSFLLFWNLDLESQVVM